MSLKVFESGGLAMDGRAQCLRAPWIASQVVASAEQSAAFSDGTTIVSLVSGEAGYFEIGANPTATTNSYPLVANQPQPVGVQPGHKVSYLAA